MRHPAAACVVFTDLDGTLLDHTTYHWEAAREALQAIRDCGVPLVIVTSKTREEVPPILRGLRRREPFVVENGGAIYLPKEYFPFRIHGASPAGSGWLRIALGTPRSRLLRALAGAAESAGVLVRSFAQMSVREVATRTGLPIAAARRAQQREFDEPFVVLSGPANYRARLKREIGRAGFHLTRGSRFFHILGDNDKGSAVKRLTACFRRALGARLETAGLGDSPNDIPMLRAVDKPILVARPGGRYDRETLAAVPNAHRAGGVGPVAWNRAVLELLGHRNRSH